VLDEWNVKFAERSAGEKPMCLFGVMGSIYATRACLDCGREGLNNEKSGRDTCLAAIREKTAA
jgi:hypothetical protein